MTALRCLLVSVAWSTESANPWPLSQAQALADTAHDWYLSGSYGKVDLQFTVAPFVRSPNAGGNPATIVKLLPPGQWDRIVYLTTRDTSVGSKGLNWGSGSWVNCMNTGYEQFSMIHELGHSFGLPHESKLMNITTRSGNTYSLPPLDVVTGGNADINDPASSMGYEATMAQFPMPDKTQLGWIGTADGTLAEYMGGEQTYTLTASAEQGGKLYAVRIPMSRFRGSSQRIYWLEYRHGRTLPNGKSTDFTSGGDGIEVRVDGNFNCRHGHINNSGFQVGERVTDGTLVVDVLAMTALEATVRVATVDLAPPIPSGNTQMLIDNIKAAGNALVLDQITQAQVDAGRALWAQLVADSVGPPPVPGVTSPDGTAVPPAAQITDDKGGVWTLGTIQMSGGQQILLNGRPSTSTGAGVSLLWKGGQVYTQNSQGAWYVAGKDVAGKVSWTKATAP